MILIKARLWNVTELAGNPTVWPWDRHFTSLSLCCSVFCRILVLQGYWGTV